MGMYFGKLETLLAHLVPNLRHRSRDEAELHAQKQCLRELW